MRTEVNTLPAIAPNDGGAVPPLRRHGRRHVLRTATDDKSRLSQVAPRLIVRRDDLREVGGGTEAAPRTRRLW